MGNKRPFQNLKGQKFGRLMVQEYAGLNKYGGAIWTCSCECGNIVPVNAGSLKNGTTQSCGCLRNGSFGGYRNAFTEGIDINPQVAFEYLYDGYKNGAENRGLSFDLSEEDFYYLTKGECYYCGRPSSQKRKSGNSVYMYTGIDRMDNSIGYTQDNCVSCCKVCNKAKSTMDTAEFLEWIEKTFNYLKLFGLVEIFEGEQI